MAELQLTRADLDELLLLLNIVLYDINERIERSQDIQQVSQLEERQEKVRKWIHRLSKQIGSESE